MKRGNSSILHAAEKYRQCQSIMMMITTIKKTKDVIAINWDIVIYLFYTRKNWLLKHLTASVIKYFVFTNFSAAARRRY